MSLTVEVVSTPHGFVALEREWIELGEVAACPFVRYEWMDAARCANTESHALAVIAARRNGVLAGIAPLFVDRARGVPTLRSIDCYIGEFNAFLFRDEDVLQALCDQVLALRMPIDLRLLAAGRELALLRRSGRSLAVRTARPAKPVRAAPLDPDWARLEAGMSDSSRRYMQRRRKIARRWGEPQLRVVHPTPDDVERELQAFVRIEGAGWKSRGGTSIREDERMARFVFEMARRFAATDRLRLYFLCLGENVVAGRLTILHENRLWEIKIGFDEQYAQCSPGLLLMHETLRHACANGIAGYEYLGVAEDWQLHWPHVERACDHLRSYPATLAGLALLSGTLRDSLVARSRATLQALRPDMPSPRNGPG